MNYTPESPKTPFFGWVVVGWGMGVVKLHQPTFLFIYFLQHPIISESNAPLTFNE